MLKRMRRRFGAAAPRVAVRTHIPWPLRGVAVVLLVLVASALAWWIYDAGRQYSGVGGSSAGPEVQLVAQAEQRLQKENEQLTARAAAAESQLQMEHAARDDLAKQVKALVEENARLKEDLAFFQHLVPGSGKNGELQVYRFKVERDTLPGEFRYGLLLVHAGQRGKEFQGSLQLVVNLNHNGIRKVVVLPEDQKKYPRGQNLNFRYYQRVEGRFQVASDAVVESLQVRIFSYGASEAAVTQTAKVS
jgi:uncharacterized protein DUF6776